MDYSRRKRMLLYALGALGTGYGAYRVYNLPAVIKKRQRLLKVLGAFVTVIEMVSDSAEVVGIVATDLKHYIQSDSTQMPRSLRQLSMISRSRELSESVTSITRAVTIGILAGYQYEAEEDCLRISKTTLPDRVLDKLFSDAGSGFASVVVGSFAKNLVMAFCDVLQQTNHFDDLNQDYTSSPPWVNVLCDDKVRALVGECVQTFVSTAISVYLAKTVNINTYDQIFSGLTNPKHDTRVRELVVSVCNGAVGTFVRTSYNVLTHSDAESNTNSSSGRRKAVNDRPLIMSNTFKGLSKMSSTLEISGRATLESYISYMKLLIEKVSEILMKSGDLVQEEVIEMGAEAFRYASRKSSAVVTICLSLCLHILNSPWLLVQS